MRARRYAFGIVVAIGLRSLIGDAERLSARHDRHAIHRVGAGHDQAEDRVSALVIGDALAILAAQQQRTLRTEHDLLERIEKVFLVDFVSVRAEPRAAPPR